MEATKNQTHFRAEEQLDDEGHSVNFHGGKWKVCMGAKILASGYKTDILYMTTNIRDIVIVTGASVD